MELPLYLSLFPSHTAQPVISVSKDPSNPYSGTESPQVLEYWDWVGSSPKENLTPPPCTLPCDEAPPPAPSNTSRDPGPGVGRGCICISEPCPLSPGPTTDAAVLAQHTCQGLCTSPTKAIVLEIKPFDTGSGCQGRSQSSGPLGQNREEPEGLRHSCHTALPSFSQDSGHSVPCDGETTWLTPTPRGNTCFFQMPSPSHIPESGFPSTQPPPSWAVTAPIPTVRRDESGTGRGRNVGWTQGWALVSHRGTSIALVSRTLPSHVL